MTREEFIMKYLTGDVAQAMAALERVQGAARTQLADYVVEHTHLPVVSAAKVALLTERNMPADANRQVHLAKVLYDDASKLERLTTGGDTSVDRRYVDQTLIAKNLSDAVLRLDADGLRNGTVGMKLKAGEVVLTVTGRPTTPFPKIDVTSERKAVNTIKRVDAWLIDNAVQEAKARKDEFNARQFTQAAQQKHLSQGDKDSAEFYLFDDEAYTPPPKPFLKPLV